MELWIGALNLSYLYAFMTMGVFITARVFNQPDITVDGSFTTGAATAAVLIAAGYHPLTALAAAFVAGSIAGAITGIIHTRWSIHPLLAGILVMTGLYSVNLHVMGRSNIPLLNQTTLFSLIKGFNPGLPPELFIFVILTAGMVLFWFVVSFFFLTDMGVAMRATGSNTVMASANGIHVSRMVIFGMALANGLVGVSGGLVAQYQGFADIGMGIGTIVIGVLTVRGQRAGRARARKIDAKTEAIHEQTVNTHDTNMRDDLDEIRDMVKVISARQIDQGRDIRGLRTDVGELRGADRTARAEHDDRDDHARDNHEHQNLTRPQ